MSDDEAPKDVPPGGQPTPPPGDQYPPNWGSAYPPPPPPGGQYPPNYGSAQPSPGQPHPAYQQPGFAIQPPAHPQATTSMVLGIVALTGFCLCYITIFLAPVAWYLGSKSVKEIDANPQALSGRGQANAGKILGIIGTIVMVLSLLAIAGFAVLMATSSDFRQGFDEGYDSFLLNGLR